MSSPVKSRLQEKRIEKQLTRPQLANSVGVGWEAIKAYEVKGATPSLPVALRIAEVLESTVDNLFELKEKEPS